MDWLLKDREDVTAVLAAVRTRLHNPRSWCKNTPYTNTATDLTFAVKAEAWSLARVRNRDPWTLLDLTYRYLAEITGYRLLVDFNDSPRTKHKDVLKALDDALDAL